MEPAIVDIIYLYVRKCLDEVSVWDVEATVSFVVDIVDLSFQSSSPFEVSIIIGSGVLI